MKHRLISPNCKSIVKEGKASISGRPDHTPSITLLFFIGTHGTPLTTALIWPQSSVPPELQELSAYNIKVFANESGWMTRPTFEFLMLRVYIPELVERRRKLMAENKKILLLLDRHSSRMSLPVILACIKENITILILPAHSSSITQPNDRGVNGTFKTWFAKLALTYINRIRDLQDLQAEAQSVDPPKVIDNEDSDYPPCPNLYPSQEFFDTNTARGYRNLLKTILPAAVEHALCQNVIKSAWEVTGLHP